MPQNIRHIENEASFFKNLILAKIASFFSCSFLIVSFEIFLTAANPIALGHIWLCAAFGGLIYFQYSISFIYIEQ